MASALHWPVGGRRPRPNRRPARRAWHRSEGIGIPNISWRYAWFRSRMVGGLPASRWSTSTHLHVGRTERVQPNVSR